MTREEARASFPAEPAPGEHYWVREEQAEAMWPALAARKPWLPSCLWCGLMRRGDGKPQKPCRGRVGVGLRAAPTEGGAR